MTGVGRQADLGASVRDYADMLDPERPTPSASAGASQASPQSPPTALPSRCRAHPSLARSWRGGGRKSMPAPLPVWRAARVGGEARESSAA